MSMMWGGCCKSVAAISTVLGSAWSMLDSAFVMLNKYVADGPHPRVPLVGTRQWLRFLGGGGGRRGVLGEEGSCCGKGVWIV